MTLLPAWLIAMRYFRHTQYTNAVNLLSRIAIVAIAVGTAAMFIIFSVFNGFDVLVKKIYSSFNPEIRIAAASGKFFAVDSAMVNRVKAIPGIAALSISIEDNVLLADNNSLENGKNSRQKIAVLKGIDSSYFNVNPITDSIEGEKNVGTRGGVPTAIVGKQIAYFLATDYKNNFSFISCYYINPNVSPDALHATDAFNVLQVHPAGLFEIGGEPDDKYILAPLSAVQSLLGQQGKCSYMEISLVAGADAASIAAQISHIIGNKYTVETRLQQNKTIYTMLNGEKWAMYLILSFVLLIASFTMIGALTMLVLEKKRDITILQAMGATQRTIALIFLMEGMLWAVAGAVLGLLLGACIAGAQQYWGIIKLGGSFVVESYPVKMLFTDALLIAVTMLALGILASAYPAYSVAKSRKS
ncbi:MAG: FtsX-like permease family protein [Chitinophagia bacterium]|nr:FtsX-like permease family protein [Chitinophagia bacterium]